MACISFILALSMLAGSACGATHTVTFSDTAIWTVGMGVTYPDFAITVGESLKFVSYSHHDVALLHAPSSGTHWDQCGMEGIGSDSFTTIWATTDFSDTSATAKLYMPPTCGDFYIACSLPPHCAYGQRVKITVNNADGSPCTSPCVGAACVTANSKPSMASGTVHDVKQAPNSQFWGMTAPYDALTVEVGDTVLFRTGAGYHDVATVPTLSDLNTCDMSSMTVVADWDFTSGMPTVACNGSSACCAGSSCGSSGMFVTYTFTAETEGDVYFVCSLGAGSHCQTGQKFMLKVIAPNIEESSAVTCGQIKQAYKDSNCCGSPSSTFRFPENRRLANPRLSDEPSMVVHKLKAALEAARAQGDEAKVRQLASSIMTLLNEHLEYKQI